eukprot:Hpha_TRINITY_DN13973_c0_g1::TRINITY_DN13973_c0_g1_i1::g.35367::m.35367
MSGGGVARHVHSTRDAMKQMESSQVMTFALHLDQDHTDQNKQQSSPRGPRGSVAGLPGCGSLLGAFGRQPTQTIATRQQRRQSVEFALASAASKDRGGIDLATDTLRFALIAFAGGKCRRLLSVVRKQQAAARTITRFLRKVVGYRTAFVETALRQWNNIEQKSKDPFVPAAPRSPLLSVTPVERKVSTSSARSSCASEGGGGLYLNVPLIEKTTPLSTADRLAVDPHPGRKLSPVPVFRSPRTPRQVLVCDNSTKRQVLIEMWDTRRKTKMQKLPEKRKRHFTVPSPRNRNHGSLAPHAVERAMSVPNVPGAVRCAVEAALLADGNLRDGRKTMSVQLNTYTAAGALLDAVYGRDAEDWCDADLRVLEDICWNPMVEIQLSLADVLPQRLSKREIDKLAQTDWSKKAKQRMKDEMNGTSRVIEEQLGFVEQFRLRAQAHAPDAYSFPRSGPPTPIMPPATIDFKPERVVSSSAYERVVSSIEPPTKEEDSPSPSLSRGPLSLSCPLPTDTLGTRDSLDTIDMASRGVPGLLPPRVASTPAGGLLPLSVGLSGKKTCPPGLTSPVSVRESARFPKDLTTPELRRPELTSPESDASSMSSLRSLASRGPRSHAQTARRSGQPRRGGRTTSPETRMASITQFAGALGSSARPRGLPPVRKPPVPMGLPVSPASQHRA